MKPESLKVIWFYFLKCFDRVKQSILTMNICLHIFHTGICAKFLKLRCKRFKSHLFDNQSLIFCIVFNREAAKYPKEKP